MSLQITGRPVPRIDISGADTFGSDHGLPHLPKIKSPLKADFGTKNKKKRVEPICDLNPESELSTCFSKLTLEENRDKVKAKIKAKEEAPDNTIKVRQRFESSYEYFKLFESLIKMESESKKKRDIEVRWLRGCIGLMAFFKFPIEHKDTDNEIVRGDRLRLTLKKKLCKPWTGIGYVFKTPDHNKEVGIIMEFTKDVPILQTSGFVVEFVWESVAYDRMVAALHNFQRWNSPLVPYIRCKLLGKQVTDISVDNPIPKELKAPNLPKLNESQVNAIKLCLQSPISLIQGPPGTGKTVTSATIVYHLAKSGKTPVLVCAQSNIAVDQLTEKIEKTGLNIVRLYSKQKEGSNTLIQRAALHRIILKMDPELRELQKLKEKNPELFGRTVRSVEEKRYNFLKKRCESSVLERVDVICCTCIGAGDRRLAPIKFKSLLIDESTQATEPECLVPIMRAPNHLVLVGDHMQLGPVVTSNKAAIGGLSQSMFERLIGLGISHSRLEIQYRMHPSLSQFPSAKFYENSLQNGVTSSERKMTKLSFLWPNPEKPLFFNSCNGKEEKDSSGTSFFNRKEATIVGNIVSTFLKCGIKAKQIGVITPYEGQRAYLVRHLQYNRCYRRDLEVASVNAFQGREKDLIIFSCVRSNKQQTIGFVKDPRRLNVALTRARFGLIIVGNPKTLSSDPLWKDLLTFYEKESLLVKGSLRDLKTTSY